MTKSARAEAVKVLDILRKATKDVPDTMSVVVAQEYHKDPFLLLISCLLSLRAKDFKTLPIVRRLFFVAKTPQDFISMPLVDLEKFIYSIGFYRQKARTIKSVSKELVERFDGRVPNTFEQLRSIKGIGPKTANLVLGLAFDVPAICVDVHVHRLANMLGLIRTTNPIETEKALKAILPRKYWIESNQLLVKLGQNIVQVVPRLPKDIQVRLKSLIPKCVKL